MIEIIPNWHPIFVHFTIALFSTSVGFCSLAYLVKDIKSLQCSLTCEFEVVARWCLWLAALITLGTLAAGLYAYHTVHHDEISHMAMTHHWHWALATVGGMWLAAAWSIWNYRRQKVITLVFVVWLLVIQGLLLSTGWRGGELVYRYGLGVMSLPAPEGEGYYHKMVQ